jgi:mRNA interferase MazF
LKRGELVTVVASRDYGKPRPALVIQSDRSEDSESVVVLLLSSTLVDAPHIRFTVEPSPTNGLRTISQVQIDKIQSIPRTRVGATIGRLEDDAMATVTSLIALYLGIA